MFPIITAMIVVSSVANTSTGGNVVGQGGTVHTGDSYSSVHVETVSDNSSSTVNVETSVNGDVHKESYSGTGSIGVEVTATSSGYSTHVWTPGSTTKSVSVTTTSTSTVNFDASSTLPLFHRLTTTIFDNLSHWLTSFWSLFVK